MPITSLDKQLILETTPIPSVDPYFTDSPTSTTTLNLAHLLSDDHQVLYGDPVSDAVVDRPNSDLVSLIEAEIKRSFALHQHYERAKSMVRHLAYEQQSTREGLDMILYAVKIGSFISFDYDPEIDDSRKLTSFAYFVRKVYNFEKLKKRNENFREGVAWLYDILLTWRKPLAQMAAISGPYIFSKTISRSMGELVRLLRLDPKARIIFETYNLKLWSQPDVETQNRLLSTASVIEGYKEGIPSDFIKLGIKMSFISDSPESLWLHQLLCSLPAETNSKVLHVAEQFVDDAMTENNPEGVQKAVTRLSDFLRSAFEFYKRYGIEIANEYMEDFESDFTPASQKHVKERLSEQLRTLAKTGGGSSGLEATETTGVYMSRLLHTQAAVQKSMQDILSEAAAVVIERYNEIKDMKGADSAERFRETVRLFRNIDDGTRLVPFIRAYSSFMLDKADPEEEDMVGSALREIASDVNYSRSWKRTFQELIAAGPRPCPPDLARDYRDRFGIVPNGVWDLREYQRKLYEHPDAAQRFVAHANRRVDLELYDKFVRRLVRTQKVESHVTIVGGGCGDAKKEIKLMSLFEIEGIEATLVLIDNSRYMRNRAALECHRAGVRYPAILNRDIEKLTHEDIERDINPNAQMIFFLGGGTPFNMMNRWYCYTKIHQIFHKRHILRFGETRFKEDSSAILYTRKSQPSIITPKGLSPDILVTEGDLEKSINYYAGADSLSFLSSGIEGEYKISGEALTVADGRTTLMINPGIDGLQFSYLLTQDKGPFKKGDVLLVIESGILNKKQFRQWLSGVGFDCEFQDGSYKNTLAISRMRVPDPQAKTLVESAITEYRKTRRI